MKNVPFTIKADLDLGGRVTPYINEHAPDVIIKEGGVPKTLGSSATRWEGYEYETHKFLFEIPNGLRFYIEGGDTIRYERPNDVSNREVLLFLLGSAWGALAYQRQLLPLHASAVIHDGSVYSFSGDSGAGKSTLSAALSKKGHHFFSDDVLIIDPAYLGTEARCYAGQKDLKLWQDALALVGAKGKRLVRDDESYDKFYVDPDNYSDLTTGVLKEIYLLRPNDVKPGDNPFEIKPIKGGRAIHQLNKVIYRHWYGVEIVGQKMMFEWLAKLVEHVDLYSFSRPVSKISFPDSVDFMSARLPAPRSFETKN